jgi:hypothetical protein
MEAAIEELKSREPGEEFSYRKILDRHGVDRITLSRRHQGSQAPREAQKVKQQKLNP